MSGLTMFQIDFSSKSIFFIVVSVVLLGASFFILPLYLQNRMNSLYEQSHKLSEKVTFLHRDALLLELKINQLSNLETLTDFAKKADLGLNGVPQKVIVTGGEK